MNNYITLYENTLSKEECQNLIGSFSCNVELASQGSSSQEKA